MLLLFTDDALIIGITRENVKRLVDNGKPIFLTTLSHKAPRHISIIFGETKPEILATLEAAGADIPNVYKQAAERDPL